MCRLVKESGAPGLMAILHEFPVTRAYIHWTMAGLRDPTNWKLARLPLDGLNSGQPPVYVWFGAQTT